MHARRVLILLDNCEHLVAACAALADALVRGCPQVKVLATSRAPLGIAGETVWRVPSLALPERSGPEPVERLTQYEAVRLFIERAVAARADFQVTNATAPALAEICWRLDGIPLAIELAAARVRLLGVEQIARRLDDRFRLLTGGSRTGLPRQQTLRALVDWSHDLLSDGEQSPPAPAVRVCRRAGRWRQRRPCARERASHAEEVLDLLGGLVDQSLVVAEEIPLLGRQGRCATACWRRSASMPPRSWQPVGRGWSGGAPCPLLHRPGRRGPASHAARRAASMAGAAGPGKR